MSTLRTILITATRQQALRSVVINRGPSGADGTSGGGGTVDAAAIASITHAATEKTTPVDADEIGMTDSSAAFGWKKLTWSAIKTTLKTYFDGIYQAAGVTWSTLSGKPSTFPPTIGSGAGDAVAGDDTRLTDAREPLEHGHVSSDVSDSSAIYTGGIVGRLQQLAATVEITGVIGSGLYGPSVPPILIFIGTAGYPEFSGMTGGDAWYLSVDPVSSFWQIIHTGADIDGPYTSVWLSADSGSMPPATGYVAQGDAVGDPTVTVVAGLAHALHNSRISGTVSFASGADAAFRVALGATSVGNSLFTAATELAARTAIGATFTGSALVTAANAAAAATAAGVGVGDSPVFSNVRTTGFIIDNRFASDFTIPDANATIPNGTRKAILTLLTANRVITLPATSSYAVGDRLIIQIDSANSFRVTQFQRQGTDTINGSTSLVNLPAYLNKASLYKSAEGAWSIEEFSTSATFIRDIKVGGIVGDSASSGSDGKIHIGGQANGNGGIEFPAGTFGRVFFPMDSFIAWNANNNMFLGGADVSISRISAGLIGIGTGTLGSFGGDIKLRSILPGRTDIAEGSTTPPTINKAAGSVNLAAGATSLVVTNSLVTSASYVLATVHGGDTTCKTARTTSAAGSFTITPDSPPTAETKVSFLVLS